MLVKPTFDGPGRREVVGLGALVEAQRYLATQLQVLHLVFADGHVRGLVEQDVGRLQNGIHVEAEAYLGEAVRLELELVHVSELGHGDEAAEYPRELPVLGYLAQKRARLQQRLS